MLGSTWTNFNDFMSQDLTPALTKDRSGQVWDWLTGTPDIATISPNLVRGEHVNAPTAEQQQDIWSFSNQDMANLNQQSWGNYVSNIQNDIVTNAPDRVSSQTPLTHGIETLVIIGVIGLVGLKLYKSL